MNRYSVFDNFLNNSNFTGGGGRHDLDEQKFNDALAQVIDDPEFNADDLNKYFEEWRSTKKDDPHLQAILKESLDRFVRKAEAAIDKRGK